MKREFQIEYIDESGVPQTSKIFACDEAEVRKIFQKLYGGQCSVESIIRYDIKPDMGLQLEFE